VTIRLTGRAGLVLAGLLIAPFLAVALAAQLRSSADTAGPVRRIEVVTSPPSTAAVQMLVTDEVRFAARVRPQAALLAGSIDRLNATLPRQDLPDDEWGRAVDRELDEWARIAVAVGEAGPPGRLRPMRDALFEGLAQGRFASALLREAIETSRPSVLAEANSRLAEARAAFARAIELEVTFGPLPAVAEIPPSVLERRKLPATVASLPNIDALEVRNVTAFPGVTGAEHVVGEVVNRSNLVYGQPAVTAEFRDANGRLLAQVSAYVRASSLPPGQVAPFHLIWEKGTPGARYTLSVWGSVPAGPPPAQPDLEIVEQQATTQPMGEMILTGSVRNRGEAPAQLVECVATFYDAAGHVRRVAAAPFDIVGLGPGQTATFKIVVADGAGAGVQTFRLRVETK
jgi:hypothetical protein